MPRPTARPGNGAAAVSARADGAHYLTISMPTWHASGKTHSSRCQAKGSARADMDRGIPSKSLDGMCLGTPR